MKPDLNRQSTLDQLMVDIDLLDSKNSKGRIGWGAQADWDQTLKILKKYRDLQDRPGVDGVPHERLPAAMTIARSCDRREGGDQR